MGIYVRLAPTAKTTQLERALIRLQYCREIIRFFEDFKIFKPSNYEVWLRAPSTTLGGRCVTQREVTNTHVALQELRVQFEKHFLSDELFSSIVTFYGTWTFNDTTFNGFVSCNHSLSWREVYQDIETDLYGLGDIGDLVDVFLNRKYFKEDEFQNLVQLFVNHVTNVSKEQPMVATPIYFSIGAAEYGETTDLVALHLGDWHDLIKFFYKKLRNSKEQWVRDHVTPLDRNFFVKSITEPEVVEKILSQARKETDLIEKVGNSVTYIGKDRTSFDAFFDKVKKDVFKPASKELPNATLLKDIMKSGLEHSKVTTF
jgi:hypothetical protein